MKIHAIQAERVTHEHTAGHIAKRRVVHPIAAEVAA
jgi:hypothetical protein